MVAVDGKDRNSHVDIWIFIIDMTEGSSSGQTVSISTRVSILTLESSHWHH